jgi:DNA-binding IclR family transcriptional regulator
MSKTLVRGLELIEELGLYGPMTISDLSRRSGVHVSIVSRTVSMLEPEGWVVRVDGKVAAGPRCALLGLISPAGRTVRRAEALVQALAAVTGVASAASGLIGRDVMILAASSGAGAKLPDGFSSRVPVYVMAAGRAIAAELPEETLDAILPDGDFPEVARILELLAGSAPIPGFLAGAGSDPRPGGSIPGDRSQLEADIAAIRESGFARDAGELHPAIHCIAAPWPTPELPASLACIGNREEIETNREAIEASLRAATRPGAGAQDIFDVAARAPGNDAEAH